jgi:hypothetical protein
MASFAGEKAESHDIRGRRPPGAVAPVRFLSLPVCQIDAVFLRHLFIVMSRPDHTTPTEMCFHHVSNYLTIGLRRPWSISAFSALSLARQFSGSTMHHASHVEQDVDGSYATSIGN